MNWAGYNFVSLPNGWRHFPPTIVVSSRLDLIAACWRLETTGVCSRSELIAGCPMGRSDLIPSPLRSAAWSTPIGSPPSAPTPKDSALLRSAAKLQSIDSHQCLSHDSRLSLTHNPAPPGSVRSTSKNRNS